MSKGTEIKISRIPKIESRYDARSVRNLLNRQVWLQEVHEEGRGVRPGGGRPGCTLHRAKVRRRTHAPTKPPPSPLDLIGTCTHLFMCSRDLHYIQY